MERMDFHPTDVWGRLTTKKKPGPRTRAQKATGEPLSNATLNRNTAVEVRVLTAAATKWRDQTTQLTWLAQAKKPTEDARPRVLILNDTAQRIVATRMW